jgi:hypothetical protein
MYCLLNSDFSFLLTDTEIIFFVLFSVAVAH